MIMIAPPVWGAPSVSVSVLIWILLFGNTAKAGRRELQTVDEFPHAVVPGLLNLLGAIKISAHSRRGWISEIHGPGAIRQALDFGPLRQIARCLN